ncbi:MAG TPA: tRNA pseudouridine(38-40) synthase TruA [Vicinamibacterales bacterium]|nr:tRNA pseudouridine(38-40) synthase TruA [Vicinamibacterales bacterium]
MLFKLTLSYDGTGLVGWQRQASGTSVQSLLEDALAELDGQSVTVNGAGRTDAGVHALAQVASVELAREIEPGALVRALNVRLPLSVRVTAAAVARSTFHPRFQARAKTYRYRIWNADVATPFERAYAWHILPPALDVDAMSAAAAMFLGRHDFAAFQATGTDTATSEREVVRSSVQRSAGSLTDGRALLTYEVTGNGFLRHMVRTMVGTLVDVGRRRHPPEWVAEVIASGRRSEAGPTAPAEGLFLVCVQYDADESAVVLER